jgi:hypothetical protein
LSIASTTGVRRIASAALSAGTNVRAHVSFGIASDGIHLREREGSVFGTEARAQGPTNIRVWRGREKNP